MFRLVLAGFLFAVNVCVLSAATTIEDQVLIDREVEIDLARQTVTRGRKQIHLTAKEFSMLRLMAEAAGEPVSREKFLDAVWGYTAFPTTRTVDNHILRLRQKLEDEPANPRHILSVYGEGYKFVG